MKKILCTLMTLLGLATAFAQSPNYQGIIYVTPTGAGTQSGDSWANATSSIADAQTLAQTHNAVVWVAEGTYYGVTTDTTAAFRMVSGVNVYGGFVGNEPANFNLSQRDFSMHQTILDGQNQHRVLMSANNTLWDGFTIQNGYSSWAGGGVWLGRDVHLVNCKILNNTASDKGGGIYVQIPTSYYNNTTRISNCEITNNVALRGGGCYMMSYDQSGLRIFVDSCLISNNSATQSVGGIYCDVTQLTNCTISNNTAHSIGGVQGVHSSIIDCEISSNQASYMAGGIFADYHTTVTNTTISDNTLTMSNDNYYPYTFSFNGSYYVYGCGGIFADRECTIEHCSCYNNMLILPSTTNHHYCGNGLIAKNSSILYCDIHDNHNSTLPANTSAYGAVVILSSLSNSNIHNHDTLGGLMADSSTVSNTEIYNNAKGLYIKNGKIQDSHIFRNNVGGSLYRSVAQSCVFEFNEGAPASISIEASWSTVKNSVIAFNIGTWIINAIHNTILSNCLIANNNAGEVIANWFTSASDTITTCIINSNIVNNIGCGVGGSCSNIYIKNSIISGNVNSYGNTSNIGTSGTYGAHCYFSAIEGGYAGLHNINISDLQIFVNPSLTAGSDDTTPDVDWHLLPNSICINKGLNNSVVDSVDLAGLPRIICDTVDMGCYEHYPIYEHYDTANNSFVWHNSTYTTSGDYYWIDSTTSGCDTIHILHLSFVGIDDRALGASLAVYPNPTSGVVNVECTMNNVQEGEVEYQLFDAFGRLLRKTDGVNTQNFASLQTVQIDLSHYASGVYFVKAVADGNVVAVRKVVKR